MEASITATRPQLDRQPASFSRPPICKGARFYVVVLLANALWRAFESASTVGSSMVVVDALDESAAGFYAAHGFVRLPDSLRLVLPMRLAGGMAER